MCLTIFALDRSIDLNNNEDTVISAKIDKLILTNILNGFDTRSLEQSNKDNLYVMLVTHFCDKLSYVVEGIKSLKNSESSKDCDSPLEANLNVYLEALLKYLSKVMKECPLVFVDSFAKY